MALFSAGLKLDRPLTCRAWSSVAPPAAARHAADHRAGRAARVVAARPPGRGGAAARRGARADRPGAGRRHRRRAAGRRGRARAELRADRGGGAQRRAGARRSCSPACSRPSEGGARLGRRVARRRRRLRDRRGHRASAPAVGLAAAWSVKRLRSRDMLLARRSTASTRSPPRWSSTASPRRSAATASSRSSPAGIAFRRYEPDHELNAGAHEGAERIEKLLELAVILLLGSMLTHGGPRRAGLGGLAARGAAARRRAAARGARRASSARAWTSPGEKAFVAWFGVRGVGTLYYVAAIVDLGRARGAASATCSCGRASPRCCSRSSCTASPPGRRCGGCSPGAAGRSRSGRDPLHGRRVLALVDAGRARRARARAAGSAARRARAARRPARAPAGSSARPGRRRTRAGRCRTRGRPPACCRGSAPPPRRARLMARLRPVGVAATSPETRERDGGQQRWRSRCGSPWPRSRRPSPP